MPYELKFEVNLTADQLAHIAELEALEDQEDKVHKRRGTKRTGKRASANLREELEVKAEIAAIDARVAKLTKIIEPEERQARGPGALGELIRTQMAQAQSVVQDRLQADMLRLAKGETFDLLASLTEAHPAALLLLTMDVATSRKMAEALHEPGSGTNNARHPDMDVKHRLMNEIAERDHWWQRWRELAPTKEDLEYRKAQEVFRKYGCPGSPESN